MRRGNAACHLNGALCAVRTELLADAGPSPRMTPPEQKTLAEKVQLIRNELDIRDAEANTIKSTLDRAYAEVGITPRGTLIEQANLLLSELGISSVPSAESSKISSVPSADPSPPNKGSISCRPGPTADGLSGPFGPLQSALAAHSPVCFQLGALMGSLPGDCFSLLPNSSRLDVALSPDGGFYSSRSEASSPIGRKRVAPACLEGLPWRLLVDIMTYLAACSAAQPGEPPPLPAAMATVRVQNFNDIFGDGELQLSKVLAAGHTWYVNGLANDELKELLLLEDDGGARLPLTRWLSEQMRKEPLLPDVWLSAGGTTSNLHYDPSENWHCVLAGTKHVTLYPPSDSAKLYPVVFNKAGQDVDYQYFVRPNGSLTEWLLPPQYRDHKVYAAVSEELPDLTRFPRFGDARRTDVTLGAGDCLWIPQLWWHNIRSPKGAVNLAFNLWFGMPADDSSRGDFDARQGMQMLTEALDQSMTYLEQLARGADTAGGAKTEL